MFKGTYRYRIDPKGRVPVPPPFRRSLGEVTRVVVTVLDQCLAAYPPEEWSRLEAKLSALPAFSKPVRTLSRLLTSRAADCEIDQQGRIRLPPSLRALTGLAKEVVVVGVLNRFELWAPAAWDGFLQESERLLDDVSLEVPWPPPPSPPTSDPGRDPAPPGRPQGKSSR